MVKIIFDKKVLFNLDKKLLLILPIIAGAMWGSGGVFVRELANSGFNSVTIFSTCIIVSAIILFFYLLIFNRDAFKIKIKDSWLFIGTGILGSLLLNICYNEAAFTLPLSLASLLLGLAPVFALGFAIFLFKEKITYKKLICLLITLFGCLFVSGLLESSSGFHLCYYGLIFGLCAAVSRAIYGIFSKLASDKGYQTITVVFYTFLITAICSAPFTDWNAFGTYLVSNPLPDTLIVILHSVITSILPYFLFSIALKNMEAGKTTILCCGAEPLSATLFGVLLYLEIPSVLNIIGMVICVVGLALLVKYTTPTDDVGEDDYHRSTEGHYSSKFSVYGISTQLKRNIAKLMRSI